MTDVLRASSTIATALANGAREVIPQAQIADSRERARQLGPDTLIGGERGGTMIEGFDLGNSPLEYSPARVAKRPIVLCTSNGTWALEFCRQAQIILIGAFVNLSDICGICRSYERVTIVCAGTDRQITGEDCLFAGAVIDRLAGGHPIEDDQARMAREQWIATERDANTDRTNLYPVLCECRGGRNLVRLGYEDDIRFCGTIDAVEGVPVLDQLLWTIRLTDQGN